MCSPRTITKEEGLLERSIARDCGYKFEKVFCICDKLLAYGDGIEAALVISQTDLA